MWQSDLPTLIDKLCLMSWNLSLHWLELLECIAHKATFLNMKVHGSYIWTGKPGKIGKHFPVREF